MDKRRGEVEKLTVKTESDLTKLRIALEEEQRQKIEDSIKRLEDRINVDTMNIHDAEATRQKQVNKDFESLNRKVNEEFNEAVRISECYAIVVIYDCVKKGFVDSMAEKQRYDSSLEPVKQLLQRNLPLLSKIISYHEDKDSNPKDLAKLYSLKANFEKRLERYTEALFSAEKALAYVSKIGDIQHKAGYQYNAACYASLCDLKEKALDYLELEINSNPDYRKAPCANMT